MRAPFAPCAVRRETLTQCFVLTVLFSTSSGLCSLAFTGARLIRGALSCRVLYRANLMLIAVIQYVASAIAAYLSSSSHSLLPALPRTPARSYALSAAHSRHGKFLH